MVRCSVTTPSPLAQQRPIGKVVIDENFVVEKLADSSTAKGQRYPFKVSQQRMHDAVLLCVRTVCAVVRSN